MSENHTTATKSVRELAREYVVAHEAACAALILTHQTGLPLEERIDRHLTYDAAHKKAVAARAALDAAQAQQVAA